MAQDTTHIERFAPAILGSTAAEPLLDLRLRDALTISAEKGIEVIYAPFEHVATDARLAVVGITPGLSQANVALAAVRTHLKAGEGLSEALRLAKLKASFSGGVTRSNLVRMLDVIGIQELFGLPTANALFTPCAEMVHFTSALRNPVFRNGANYNGAPDMIRTPPLRQAIETCLLEEVRALPDAIWLPLGPKPAAALAHLAAKGHLSPNRILDGVPHPSGANGESVALFLGRKKSENASPRVDAARLLAAREALVKKIATLKMGDAA